MLTENVHSVTGPKADDRICPAYRTSTLSWNRWAFNMTSPLVLQRVVCCVTPQHLTSPGRVTCRAPDCPTALKNKSLQSPRIRLEGRASTYASYSLMSVWEALSRVTRSTVRR